MHIDFEQLLTPREVKQILNLRKAKIQNMLGNGDIPTVLVSNGGKRRFFRVKPSVLKEWIAQRAAR